MILSGRVGPRRAQNMMLAHSFNEIKDFEGDNPANACVTASRAECSNSSLDMIYQLQFFTIYMAVYLLFGPWHHGPDLRDPPIRGTPGDPGEPPKDPPQEPPQETPRGPPTKVPRKSLKIKRNR